jgi:hypothetical protein
MALYITVSAGPSACAAKPVLALGDQKLIRKMLALVPRTLGDDTLAPVGTREAAVSPSGREEGR